MTNEELLEILKQRAQLLEIVAELRRNAIGFRIDARATGSSTLEMLVPICVAVAYLLERELARTP